MKLLVDTNIFLEVLLEQTRANDAKQLLSKIDLHDFLISDFSFHSIGILLVKGSAITGLVLTSVFPRPGDISRGLL